MPVITLSLKTCGALVFVSPIFGSPFLAVQTTLPEFASSATSVVSACCRKILPSPKARPRLTVSQHMTGTTSAFCFGSYFHLNDWSLRFTAYTLFGNGVCTYMVSPMTRGEPSWPRSTPVDIVHATCRLPTLLALISFRSLYR